MDITKEQLAELKAAFEKATKGEWEYHEPIGRGANTLYAKGKLLLADFDEDEGRFIALSHNLMPALIATAEEAERLRADLDHELDNSRTINSKLAKTDADFDMLMKAAEQSSFELTAARATIAELREALNDCISALAKTRAEHAEACEELGYNESELPPDAWDYIDGSIAKARAALAKLDAQNTPGHTDLMISPEAIDEALASRPAEKGARILAKWIGYDWAFMPLRRISEKGMPQFCGIPRYQGGRLDLIDVAERILAIPGAQTGRALAEAVETMRPFADVAERDIGIDETDGDVFRSMSQSNAHAKLLTVGDLRAALAFVEKHGSNGAPANGGGE